MPYSLFLKKSGKISNCRLLQIIGGALRVKKNKDQSKYESKFGKLDNKEKRTNPSGLVCVTRKGEFLGIK